MKKPSPKASKSIRRDDPQAKKEAERADTALENVREGYGPQNDRAAGNESGMGSRGGARDMTSGKRSGNQ